MKKIILFLGTLCLVGCSASSHQANQSRQPFDITKNEKRLNTADCQDADDWYLDGFRVGKTYKAYKQKMFSQRVAFCEATQNVSDKLKATWEQGYKAGLAKK